MEFKDLFTYLKSFEFPYLLTLLNLAMGMTSIFFAVAKDHKVAAMFMFGAVVFDLVDDKIAKIMRRETETGYTLERIASFTSFGVAPVVIAFQTTRNIHNGWIFAVIIYVVFLCSAALHTARMQTLREEKFYEGLPVIVNGAIVPILALIGLTNWYPLILLMSAIAMVLTFRIKRVF